MHLDLLATLLEVARGGGMRRAAHALHVSQPAVSARIRELERRLDARLFERQGRRLVLTEAGRLVAAEAPALLDAAASLARRVAELQGGGAGTLRLATIDAASIYVLPELYLEFRRRHPAVQLVVQVVDSRRVLGAVAEMEVDAGILALPASHPEVAVTPFFEDPLVVVAAPQHPLAARSRVALREVAAEPLVLYGRGSTTRAGLDALFQAHGLVPNVVMETASPEAMKRLAEVGVGLTIVPRALVAAECAAGRLGVVGVRDARFGRRLAVAVRRGRTLPPAAQRFVALLAARWPPLAAAAGRAPRRRASSTSRAVRAAKAPRGAPSPVRPARSVRSRRSRPSG